MAFRTKPAKDKSALKRARKLRRERVFAVLPTALTLGNAVCGFGAITFLSGWTGYEKTTCLFTAACLIYLAMVFDAFDGATARWTKQTSAFGAELDSLCDAISFGAAPALLMLQLSEPAGYNRRVVWVAAALYVVCTVLRLARYNVEPADEADPRSFTGLPSPAAAAVVASFPVAVSGPELLVAGYDPAKEDYQLLNTIAVHILPVITFAVAGLMVSKFRYHRHFLVRSKRNARSLVKLLFVVSMIAAIPRIAAPLLSCWYAFATPLGHVWERYVLSRFARRPVPPAPVATPEPPPARNGAPGPSGN